MLLLKKKTAIQICLTDFISFLRRYKVIVLFLENVWNKLQAYSQTILEYFACRSPEEGEDKKNINRKLRYSPYYVTNIRINNVLLLIHLFNQNSHLLVMKCFIILPLF